MNEKKESSKTSLDKFAEETLTETPKEAKERPPKGETGTNIVWDIVRESILDSIRRYKQAGPNDFHASELTDCQKMVKLSKKFPIAAINVNAKMIMGELIHIGAEQKLAEKYDGVKEAEKVKKAGPYNVHMHADFYSEEEDTVWEIKSKELLFPPRGKSWDERIAEVEPFHAQQALTYKWGFDASKAKLWYITPYWSSVLEVKPEKYQDQSSPFPQQESLLDGEITEGYMVKLIDGRGKHIRQGNCSWCPFKHFCRDSLLIEHLEKKERMLTRKVSKWGWKDE